MIMFRDVLRRAAGPITILVVVLACAVLIVTRSGTDNQDGGRSETTSAAPTQSPSKQPSPNVEQTLSARVLEFEAAYLIADPAKRLAALKPYADPAFLATLPKKLGTSPAEQAAAQLSYTLDDNSWIDTEFMDASTLYVTATLGVTSHLDGAIVTSYQIKHETVWVKSTNDQWYAYAPGESQGGEN